MRGGQARLGRATLVAGVAGTLGALSDSLLGATIQAAYYCPACGEPVEAPVHRRCGRATILVRGQRWITNDVVNALATATGALAGAGLDRLLDWRSLFACGALSPASTGQGNSALAVQDPG